MRFKCWPITGLVAIAAALITAPSAIAAAGDEKLDMYVLQGPADKVAEAAQGVELSDIQQTPAGTKADAVLSARQANKVRKHGVKADLMRNGKGQTVSEQARLMAASGYNVWRSWDEPGGFKDQLHRDRRRESRHRGARGPRHHPSGPGAARAEAGRAQEGPRQAPGGPLHLDSSTPASGSPPRSTGARCATSSTSTGRATPRSSNWSRTTSCGSSSSPTPTATSTRSTTSGCGARTCATTTTTGRSARSTASTPTATSTSTGATTTRAPRAIARQRPTAARAPRRSPRPRRCRA